MHSYINTRHSILPMRRRQNYDILADIQIDDNRTTAITKAKAIKGLVAFTDGSGYEEKIGAAAILMVNGMELKTLRYRLGHETEHTVYEAEMLAVLLALHLISQVARRLKRITIGLDNQATLLGLRNQRSKPSHYLLDKIHDALEDLQVTEARKRGIATCGYRTGKGKVKLDDGTMGWKDWKLKRWCKVKFVWTPGHEDIEGNERADKEAKLAAETGSNAKKHQPAWLRGRALPISISATRQALKSDAKKRWKTEWSESPRHQNSANIDCSLPSDNFLHIAGQLQRHQASILIQLRTRHIPLNFHLARIKRTDTPDCPHCRSGTRETLLHYILFCPHYDTARSNIRGIIQKEKNAIAFLMGNRRGIPPLLRYIGETKRFHTIFGDVTPPRNFSLQNKK
jgi:ribonuclease HI